MRVGPNCHLQFPCAASPARASINPGPEQRRFDPTLLVVFIDGAQSYFTECIDELSEKVNCPSKILTYC